MKKTIIAALLALASIGCSLLPHGLRGLPSGGPPRSAQSTSPQAAQDLAKQEDSSGGRKSATRAEVEADLAKLLEAEVRFSAAVVQSKPAQLCNASNDRTALSVWSVDKQERVFCYAFNEADLGRYGFRKFDGMRDFQDAGTIYEAAFFGKPDAEGISFMMHKDAIWAFEVGPELGILRVPTKRFEKPLDRDFVFQWYKNFAELDQAQVDVLTSDRAKAGGIDLAQTRTRLLSKLAAALEKFGKEKSKADAAKLAKAVFPKAVGSDPGLIRAAKDHIAGGKPEIDPKGVKKVAVTSGWTQNRNAYGIVLSRVADVSVGFKRSDEYSIDPNKACAFVTFEVKQNYDGATYSDAFATGMATGWTNIACDRLK